MLLSFFFQSESPGAKRGVWSSEVARWNLLRNIMLLLPILLLLLHAGLHAPLLLHGKHVAPGQPAERD